MGEFVEIFKNLDNFFNIKEKEIKNLIISEKEAENQFMEIESFTKDTIEKVFGYEKYTKIDDKENLLHNQVFGLTEELLQYREAYKDGVLFSYWSHRGVPFKEKYLGDSIKHRRGNLFYKGQRWKDKEKKNLFYSFFDIIKEVFLSEIPVDFISFFGIKAKKHYLKVITSKDYTIDINTSLMDEIIILPDLSNYESKSLIFNDFIKFILLLKNTTDALKFNN